jgi:hypothetical protein
MGCEDHYLLFMQLPAGAALENGSAGSVGIQGRDRSWRQRLRFWLTPSTSSLVSGSGGILL